MKTVNDLLKTQRKPSKRRDTIVFDESARKSYVTGFKKRKDERREQARKENEEKARKAKIEARKERRQAMQYALSGGIVNRTADEDEDEEPAAEPEKMQPLFKKRTVFQNTLTTTTVTALHDSSDATFLTHTAESSEALAARLAVRKAQQNAKRASALDKGKRQRGSRGKGPSKPKGNGGSRPSKSKGVAKGGSKGGKGGGKVGRKGGAGPKGASKGGRSSFFK
jgi:ribosomal RNA-processing protein 17